MNLEKLVYKVRIQYQEISCKYKGHVRTYRNVPWNILLMNVAATFFAASCLPSSSTITRTLGLATVRNDEIRWYLRIELDGN